MNKEYYQEAEKELTEMVKANKWNYNKIRELADICIEGQELGYIEQAKG